MTGQLLYVSQLDVAVTSASATVSGADTTSFSGDATAEVNIGKNMLQALFQYESDSIDINDVTSQDVKFRVVYSTSQDPLSINLDNNTLVTTNPIHGAALDNHVTFDFTRYLALKLLGTHAAVDIFDNEEALRSTLNDQFKTNFNSVLLSLIGVEADQSVASSSPSKSIFNQLIKNEASRFSDITSYEAEVANGRHWYRMPILAGDRLYFRLTVSAASGQESLTGVSPVPDRVYLIQINAVDV
jgi:hypothetical protein